MSSNSSDDSVDKNSSKFDEKFIIQLTNENTKITDKDVRQNCKILQISSELEIDQKLAIINTLEPTEYPNLFIFIIEHQNGAVLNENLGTQAQQLEECLNKFAAARPLIIQQTCEVENKTKFYYKNEKSSKILDIDQHYPEDYELYEKWQNKLSSLLDQELQPFENELLKKLSHIKDSSIILRFLRTLNIQEAFFGTLVLEIAKSGSKADLLAILDASFEENGRILNEQAQNYIQFVFEGNNPENESADAPDEGQIQEEPTLEESSVDVQDDPMEVVSSQSKNEDSSQSVFLTAVQHSNKKIIDYLITYWTPLIQELPVQHQIRISTAAFDTNQLDVLCDLLEISDFPFPENFTITKSEVIEKLSKLTLERLEFKAAIEKEGFHKIDEFISSNQNLKFIYNIDNNSALTEAVKARKFGVFYYLKSLGFQGENCQDILDNLNEEERKQAVKLATEQRKINVKISLQNYHKAVLQLSARSLIHNRKISKDQEAECRGRIKNWLKDIQKIAPEMLDVAASCEHLKIIFDFESNSVSVSLKVSNIFLL